MCPATHPHNGLPCDRTGPHEVHVHDGPSLAHLGYRACSGCHAWCDPGTEQD